MTTSLRVYSDIDNKRVDTPHPTLAHMLLSQHLVKCDSSPGGWACHASSEKYYFSEAYETHTTEKWNHDQDNERPTRKTESVAECSIVRPPHFTVSAVVACVPPPHVTRLTHLSHGRSSFWKIRNAKQLSLARRPPPSVAPTHAEPTTQKR